MELAVARHVRVLLVNEASHFCLASPVARLQQSGPQLCLHAAMTVKMAFVASQKKAPITAQRSLHDQGYQQIEPSIWGSFLGDPVLGANAVKNGVPGIVVTDSSDIYWHPRPESPRPLTPDDVYNLYKGRKLLKTFNP